MFHKSLFLAAVAFTTLAPSVLAQAPFVGSVALYECTASAIPYECPDAPCRISARVSGDLSSAIEETTVNDAAGTWSWTVNAAEGTSVTIYIRTAGGTEQNSAATPVFAGDDSCLAGGASSGSTSATGTSSRSTTTLPGTTTTPAGTSSSVSTPVTTTSTTTTSASSDSSVSSSRSSSSSSSSAASSSSSSLSSSASESAPSSTPTGAANVVGASTFLAGSLALVAAYLA